MTLHAPSEKLTMRTAAQALVEQLIAQRVTHVFCVPGESYLAVLDALYDSGIHVTACRNEAGAVTALVPPNTPLQPGDNVTLLFDPWRVHVFGADGHNLRRDAPPVGSAEPLVHAVS